MKFHAIIQKEFLKHQNSLSLNLQICKVFSEAIYFKSEDHKVFLVHDLKFGLIPFGIAIPKVKKIIERYDISTATQLKWHDHILYLPEMGLQIVAKERQPHSCSDNVPNKKSLMRTLDCGTKFLGECNKGSIKEILWDTEYDGIKNVYIKKVFFPLKKLEHGMESEDSRMINEALCEILGLGPGLTPSMDDFLVAVIFTCLYLEKCWEIEIPGSKKLARQVMNLAQKKTGEISAAYLVAAAEGGIFSLLEELLCDEKCRVSIYKRFILLGDSSGIDQITGVIWSIKYILKHLEMSRV